MKKHLIEIEKDVHLELQRLRRASGIPTKKLVGLAISEWIAKHCNEGTIVGQTLRSIQKEEISQVDDFTHAVKTVEAVIKKTD